MGQLKVAPHVIEAVLNHRSGIISGIAAIYNKYEYQREKAAALRRYGEYVESLIQKHFHKEQPIRQNPLAESHAEVSTTRPLRIVRR
jgi:hypothetical protein